MQRTLRVTDRGMARRVAPAEPLAGHEFLDAAAVKYAVFGEVEWTSETVKRWQHKLSARSDKMYGWLSKILGKWGPERAQQFCRFATSSKQPHKVQIRDVAAGDQQDQKPCGHKHRK